MAFTELFTAYFPEYGTDALINGAQVRGILDLSPADQFGIVGGLRQTFFCETAAVSDVATGDTLTASDVDYTIREISPDGTGMTTLVLETA